MRQLQPTGDKLLVQIFKEDSGRERRSKGGILLPDGSERQPAKRGKVLAVGPGRMTDEGAIIPSSAKVGEVVVFSHYAGTDIKHNGEECVVLHSHDVLIVGDEESIKVLDM